MSHTHVQLIVRAFVVEMEVETNGHTFKKRVARATPFFGSGLDDRAAKMDVEGSKTACWGLERVWG
jgi:hypothetical protein